MMAAWFEGKHFFFLHDGQQHSGRLLAELCEILNIIVSNKMIKKLQDHSRLQDLKVYSLKKSNWHNLNIKNGNSVHFYCNYQTIASRTVSVRIIIHLAQHNVSSTSKRIFLPIYSLCGLLCWHIEDTTCRLQQAKVDGWFICHQNILIRLKSCLVIKNKLLCNVLHLINIQTYGSAASVSLPETYTRQS